MMNMFKQVAVLVVMILALSGCFGRSQPLYEVHDMQVPDSARGLSDEQLTAAIRAAGSKRRWSMEKINPGLMRGTLKLRSHVAVVDIAYSNEAISLSHNSSQNLQFDGTNIHRNYNLWIRNLELDITESLRAAGAKSS
jgi:hypothetical protein